MTTTHKVEIHGSAFIEVDLDKERKRLIGLKIDQPLQNGHDTLFLLAYMQANTLLATKPKGVSFEDWLPEALHLSTKMLLDTLVECNTKDYLRGV